MGIIIIAIPESNTVRIYKSINSKLFYIKTKNNNISLKVLMRT